MKKIISLRVKVFAVTVDITGVVSLSYALLAKRRGIEAKLNHYIDMLLALKVMSVVTPLSVHEL